MHKEIIITRIVKSIIRDLKDERNVKIIINKNNKTIKVYEKQIRVYAAYRLDKNKWECFYQDSHKIKWNN